MAAQLNQNRFFVLFYPFLLGASLVVSILLFRREWSGGFYYLHTLFEIQLILVTLLWLLYLLAALLRKYAWITLAWVLVSILWGGGTWLLTEPAEMMHLYGPDTIWIRTLIRIMTGCLFLAVWAHAERAVHFEECRQAERLKLLADRARVTESQLAYLEARIEPVFLLKALKGVARLRKTDMQGAELLQIKLVDYLKESLGDRGQDRGLKAEIRDILETS